MKYRLTNAALPELALVEQAERLKKLGFDGIELRVRRVPEGAREKPPSSWGYHATDITPENFRDKAPEIRQVLSDYGLQLAGLASNPNCTDLEQVKLLLDGAVAAGAPFVRVGAGDYAAHLRVGAHKPTGSELDDNGTAKWAWEACNMGEGLYDYTKLMAALKKTDYQGFISIEDFRPIPPEDKYRNGIDYLRRTEAAAG